MDPTDPAAMGALNGQPPQAKPAQPQQPQQPQPQQPPQGQQPQQGQGGQGGAGKLGPLGKAMQQWMMDAYAIGATGGDVVRSGLESAYDNYAEIMTSMMQKNLQGARQARTGWKEAAEGTLAFNDSRLREYKEIFSGDSPDKLGMLHEVAEGHYGDRLMAGLAQEQNTTAIGRYIDVLGQQQQKAEAATKMLEAQFAEIEAKLPQETQGQSSGMLGPTPPDKIQ